MAKVNTATKATNGFSAELINAITAEAARSGCVVLIASVPAELVGQAKAKNGKEYFNFPFFNEHEGRASAAMFGPSKTVFKASFGGGRISVPLVWVEIKPETAEDKAPKGRSVTL